MTQTTLLKSTTLSLLLSLCTFQANAQKDTEFWFVAPEIARNSASNFDRPVAFRFSTYGAPAVVNVSQPANPAFPVQTITIAANTSGILMFPPFFDMVENVPANTVLNKGFLIQSTTPITAYYELIGGVPNNPELFSLKGKNALGTLFYTPFQNVTDNSAAYTPLPHAAFDIVATENNTTVTITPTRAIVGHAANIPFNITLNRGQTYSGEAGSQLAAQHPTGSKIVSNKPIAVTLKDDLLEGGPLFGGFCRDVMADQLVPVEKLGTRYVVHKGFLNGNEFAFVVATQNGTQVKLDGFVAGNINTGQMLNLSITAGAHFIESSAPIYVLQMTGMNCEVAGEIIPAIDCSGSNAVRFVRSTSESFQLFLTTRAGFEDGFSLNGNPNLIFPGAFQVVPGSGGEFVSAVIEFPDSSVPTGLSSVVSNNQGLFQTGFLNGGVSTGCRFGFFSDFGNKVILENSFALCPNDTILIEGQNYTAPASVSFNHPGVNGECDTVLVYELVLKNQVIVNQNVSLCPGETVSLGGQNYTAPATVNLVLTGVGEACDTLATYNLILKPQSTISQNISLCPGETVSLGGQNYTAPATVNLVLAGVGETCDTLATYNLVLLSQPTLNQNIEFCPGETITLGNTAYTQPGTVVLQLPANTGCDTVATYNLSFLTPAPSNVSIVCPANVVVNTLAGTGSVAVNYSNPIAASDCPCPGLDLSLTAGLASGSFFPTGNTQVCWQATDSCGQAASCCFNIAVQEDDPCDIKVIGCMKYELLNITADAGKNRTYRIRVTNNCANKMIYTAIQIPDGMTAINPAENSTYTAPGSGNEYLVRNPNFSPFYSVRFKSINDSISGGQSEIFRYKIPAQADPTFIHILSRLAPQVYFEAHLNTFYCQIGTTPPGGRPSEERELPLSLTPEIVLFPNPSSGILYADLSAWENQFLQFRIIGSQGQLVLQESTLAIAGPQRIELPEALSSGLYFFELLTPGGEKHTARFALIR